MQTNEYGFQALRTRLFAHTIYFQVVLETKTQLSQDIYICNRQDVMVQPSEAHNHRKIWKHWERFILPFEWWTIIHHIDHIYLKTSVEHIQFVYCKAGETLDNIYPTSIYLLPWIFHRICPVPVSNFTHIRFPRLDLGNAKYVLCISYEAGIDAAQQTHL